MFLYPTEYITNGIGWNGVHEDITPIITRPDGTKEYRISDHLASLRVSLTNGSPMQAYDYDPWGNLLSGTPTPRRGFNDNEKDRENGLFSLGVRKYEEGRFLSIDPLFEKEPEISPYVYAGNTPLNYVDPDGMQRRNTSDPLQTIRVQLPGGRLYVGLPENFAPTIPKSSYEHVGANQRAMEIRSQAARTGANAQPLPNAPIKSIVSANSSGSGVQTLQNTAKEATASGANAKPTIPEKYWTGKKAPTQVQPGVKQIIDQKPSSRSKGEVYERTSHYDQYGRQVGQTHKTDHGEPAVHPNPHYHVRNPVTGEVSQPLPGTYPQ